MKKIILLSIIIIASVVVWFYTQEIEKKGDKPLTFYGNVENRTQEFSFRFLGKIKTITKDEGESFVKNEKLITLDTAPLKYNLENIEAQIRAEKEIFQKLKNGYRKEDIAKAKEALAESKAMLIGAKDIYERQKDLIATGDTPEQNYVQSKSQYEKADANYKRAISNYKLLKNGYQSEDIMAQEQKVISLKAQAKKIAYDINDSTLYAPNSGTILTRNSEPGSIALPGISILEVALENEYWVRAYIDEPFLGHIKKDESMLIYTDSKKEPYEGYVGFISPIAEFTPKNIETTQLRPDLVYRFRVIVKNPDSMLKQGMPVTIKPKKDR